MLTRLNGLFTWWRKQMRDLVPTSLRRPGLSLRKVLVVTLDTIDAKEVGLSLEGRGGPRFLGRHTLGAGLRTALGRTTRRVRRSTVLEVPAASLMERQVILPLSAELDLRRVVAYEMDRLTPFRAEELMWSCTTERRDTAHKRIHVRVAIVPMLHVQTILNVLRQAGLAPARIRGSGQGQRGTIPISVNAPTRVWAGPRTVVGLSLACATLAITATTLPFVAQTIAQNAADARIAAMRPQVIEVENLRKVINSGTSTADVIAADRIRIGRALRAVALLTDTLPDDTYLTLLTVHQRQISMSGHAASAARLIGTLAANPQLRNPAFSAPVVRDENNSGEMFSIRVEVES